MIVKSQVASIGTAVDIKFASECEGEKYAAANPYMDHADR